MFPSRLTLRCFVAMLALTAALPFAASAEGQAGRATPDPQDPALTPKLPLIRPATPTRVTAPMRLRARPAVLPAKAEHFTDDGFEQPPFAPTSRELAKLEAARASVAAARAAGILSAPSVRPLDLARPLHEALGGAADKLERLRLGQPAPVATDPAQSGLPAVLQSRQKQGAKVPTAAELEKLKANPASRVTPETDKETER